MRSFATLRQSDRIQRTLPLRALLQALPADIPLAIELRSKSLRDAYPNPGERAQITARATRAWLNEAAGAADAGSTASNAAHGGYPAQ